ncbi:hypothetical protein HXX76_012739 [Chlamydomonas incerta]|uniref:Uncharacterized protein n=1 Tax=Chlamydomonas incerta TaxID=51695 RepID=A0A835SH84_CHLIN|nr:hypothetical protein HXX76_012739 [Chlamydomonas incerta]|eukprot:KAG2426954.1 hypothetical protein HXX76_012739 [Chlamydomonas incerta]
MLPPTDSPLHALVGEHGQPQLVSAMEEFPGLSELVGLQAEVLGRLERALGVAPAQTKHTDASGVLKCQSLNPPGAAANLFRSYRTPRASPTSPTSPIPASTPTPPRLRTMTQAVSTYTMPLPGGGSLRRIYTKTTASPPDGWPTPQLDVEIGGTAAELIFYVALGPKASLTHDLAYLDKYYNQPPPLQEAAPGQEPPQQQLPSFKALEAEARKTPGFSPFVSPSLWVRAQAAGALCFNVAWGPAAAAGAADADAGAGAAASAAGGADANAAAMAAMRRYTLTLVDIWLAHLLADAAADAAAAAGAAASMDGAAEGDEGTTDGEKEEAGSWRGGGDAWEREGWRRAGRVLRNHMRYDPLTPMLYPVFGEAQVTAWMETVAGEEAAASSKMSSAAESGPASAAASSPVTSGLLAGRGAAASAPAPAGPAAAAAHPATAAAGAGSHDSAAQSFPFFHHLIIPPLEGKAPPSTPAAGASPQAQAQAFGQTPPAPAPAAAAGGGGGAAGTPPAAAQEALLVISPGAFLPTEAFRPLAAAIQAAAPGLRLWVGVLHCDLMALGQRYADPSLPAMSEAGFKALVRNIEAAGGYSALLSQLVAQAEAAGFVARREGPARIGNMALLCQSAGCVGYDSLSYKVAAATVVLASTLNPLDYAKGRAALSLEAWPRPLMHAVGELDGQMRWFWLAPYLADAAAAATKFGARHVAVHKPVVVVPGANHAATSSGAVRAERGDIGGPAAAPYEQATRALAAPIAQFLTCHLSSHHSTQAREQAENALLEAVAATAAHTAPYTALTGLGDTAAPFTAAAAAVAAAAGSSGTQQAGLPPATPPRGACRAGGLVAGACRTAGQVTSSAMQPGVVAAAERDAAALQLAVLAALPEAARQRLCVVASVHTSVETFLYNQPLMSEMGDGRWLLNIHVLPFYKSSESERPNLTPQAPEYWLKFKCASFVAAFLGLADPGSYATPLPADLNRGTLEAALAAAPAAVAARYRQHGRAMEFGGDVDALAPGPDGQLPGSPEAFVRAARISYAHPPPPSGHHSHAPGPGHAPAGPALPPAAGTRVLVSSPYVLSPPPADVSRLPVSVTRMTGPFYTKLISPGMAMEWVWVDCLRQTDAPW